MTRGAQPREKLPRVANLRVKASYTLEHLLNSLYEQRHTGTVTLHFREGKPRAADLGRPFQIEIHEGP